MKVTIMYHIMPWEIDYALLTFSQLKKSKYFLEDDVDITIYSVLNLSSYLINWKETKLPKEYFIEKYNTISLLLCDYNHNMKIYDGNELYGHLDLQREIISKETDFYIGICPDIYFSEYLLGKLIKHGRKITTNYFVITPQVSRYMDYSWDCLVHQNFGENNHENWRNIDVFDIDNYIHISNEEVHVTPLDEFKWCGWFDLYNKSFFEEMAKMPDGWHGYGPWDWYSIRVAFNASQDGYDVIGYRLDGEIIMEYSVGKLYSEKVNGFSNYYRSLISLNDIPNQRKTIDCVLEKSVKLQKENKYGFSNIKIQ